MGERKKKIQINSAVILLVIIALLSDFIFSFVQYYREMEDVYKRQTILCPMIKQPLLLQLFVWDCAS